MTDSGINGTNPEVLLFASTTQSFLEKEAPLSRIREMHEAGAAFDPTWWRRAGEQVASWAVCEPGRPWSLLAPSVTATPTGSGFRIDGVKDRVEAGADTETFLVTTRSDGAVRQFLVPAGEPGVHVVPQRSIDMVKTHARVTFEGVEIDDSAAVGTPEKTAALIARQSQIAVMLQCAEVVGILDAVLAFTIQWGFDRHSFGRPLGSYQALKHKYADLKIWFEACRATTNAAVDEVASRSAGADLAVSIAKSYVGEYSPGMLQLCVQLHGGIGVTWEHDLHLFLRRATLNRSMFGTPEDHNLRVYALNKDLEQAS